MMRKLFTLALAVMAAMTLLASNERSRVYTYDSQGRRTYWSADGQKLGVEADAVKLPVKAPAIIGTGPSKSLGIEIRYDENEYTCEFLGGGLLDATDLRFYDPDKTMTIEVPSGVKGLVCFFKKVDASTHKTEFFANLKDITNISSGEKVVFDISECVHKISYKPLGEDGNYIDLEKRDEDNVIKRGEYQYAFSMTSINHVDDGLMWFITAPYRYVFLSGVEVLEDSGDLYMNSCGPDFFISQHIVCMPAHGADYTLIEMPVYRGVTETAPSEVELSNDPSRYRTYSREWTRSPYSVSQNDELCYGAVIRLEQNGTSPFGIGGDISFECKNSETSTNLSVCTNNPDDPSSRLMSMILIDVMPESADYGEEAMASMYWRPGENGREYLPINHTGNTVMDQPYEVYVNFVEDNYTEWLLTKGAPNDYLAFDDAKVKGRFGNSCPILSLLPADYFEEIGSDYLPWYNGLVGRYGECNTFGSGQLVDYEDDPIYGNDNLRKQTFSYDNILIDGEIEGNVSAELYIKKGSGEGVDFVPPVMTHLGMKDKDGNLTDRFETSADGTVELYAADFYLSLDWSLGEYGFRTYECKPIPDGKLKVEYAPYGCDGFAELPVTEVPDKYFYPGWGNFYTVPLESVTGKSTNGWFDLRVSMEDATGNRHVQTLSPAFKIADAAGVETVTDYDVDMRHVYYNLQGIQVQNPQGGIFIERVGNRSRKVMM